MATQDRTPPADDATGWFVGAIVALALLAIGFLVFSANSAKASEFTDIEAGSFLLYENGSPLCTAQAVKANDKVVILTANHCVKGTKSEYSIHLVDRDEANGQKLSEDVYYLEVVKRIPTTDLAVLRLIEKDVEIPLVDLATPEEATKVLIKGVEVVVAGYPNTDNSPMGELVYTDGRFTGMSKSFVPEVTVPLTRTTVPVHYGNSGGGLYVEIDGTYKLVGIASQTDPGLRWANSLFATASEINKAVRFIAPKPATDK